MAEAFRVIPQDLVTLSFYDTVDANSNKTLVSKRITFPFTTERFRVHFALNTNKKVEVEFWISPDDEAPTVKPINGINVLEPLGQVGYLVGDDEPVEILHRAKMPEVGSYIKVWAKNNDSYEHTIDAQVFLSREPQEDE